MAGFVLDSHIKVGYITIDIINKAGTTALNLQDDPQIPILGNRRMGI